MEDRTSEEKYYANAPGTGAYAKDIESDHTGSPLSYEAADEHTQLQRQMKSRHIAMIR